MRNNIHRAGQPHNDELVVRCIPMPDLRTCFQLLVVACLMLVLYIRSTTHASQAAQSAAVLALQLQASVRLDRRIVPAERVEVAGQRVGGMQLAGQLQ